MAAIGSTPISLYYSTTAAATPTAGNLVNGELAINITDGKLYYKDNGGVVKLLAGSSSGPAGGSNTQVQFNSSGVLSGSSSLTWDGSYLTAASIKDTALTSGRVTYAGASGLLQDSANLTFNGTTLTAAGFSGPISGVVTSTSITDSGLTSGRVTYASTGGLLADSAALTWDGTTLAATKFSGAFNGTVGATTPSTGAFTTLSATQTFRTTGYSSPASGAGLEIDYGVSVDTARILSYDRSASAAKNLQLLGLTIEVKAGSGLSSVGAFTSTGLNSTAIGATTPSTGAFTTLSATGTAATNTTGLTLQGTTTGFNRQRIFNTGGDLRFGIDSSVGSEALTGSAAYSSFIGSFTNTPFYLVSNSAIVGTVSSTGLAVTGTLSATGTISNTGASFSGSAAAGSLTLDSSGNLGVGTSSPAVRCDIQGVGGSLYSANPPLQVWDTQALAADIGGGIAFGGNFSGSTKTSWAGIAGLKDNATSGNYAGYLAFYTRPNGANKTEVMRLDSSGNLGLGVTPSGSSAGAFTQLQIGGSLGKSTFYGQSNDYACGLASGAYFNSSSQYVYASSTKAVSNIYAYNGSTKIQYAASGTAGNTFTPTTIADFTSTGLAVTGTLSATGNITCSAATGQLNFSGASYGQVIATGDLYLDAGASKYVYIRPNGGATAGLFSAAGLAVTGTLDTTGNISTTGGAINVASSTVSNALNVASSVTGGVVAQISSTGTSGGNYGLIINAGTTSADYGLRVRQAGTFTTLFTVAGDGATSIAGTLSATGAIKSTGANLANEASAVKLSYEGSSLSAITAYGADASTAGAFQIASKSSNGSVSGTVLSAKAAQTIALEGASRSAGTGITFPATQSASSDANTLDDYEEGVFNPQISGSTTAGAGTYTFYDGRYTKIGRQVYVEGAVIWTAHTGTGNLLISNLPFACNATQYSGVTLVKVANLTTTANNQLICRLVANSTTAEFAQIPSGGGAEGTLPIDTAATIYFSATYTV